MQENRRQLERLTRLPEVWRRASISNSAGARMDADIINLHASGARIEVQGVSTFLSELGRGETFSVHFDSAGIKVAAMLVYLETMNEKTGGGLFFPVPYERQLLHEALSRRP